MAASSPRRAGSDMRRWPERLGEALDVVLVVVEVDREAQVAVACRGRDAAPREPCEQRRRCRVAERDGDDRALVGRGELDGWPADLGQRGAQARGELAVAVV